MNELLLKETQDSYYNLTNLLIQNNTTITTMESCTSGLIASFITDTDNSSKIFKGSLVTYSNEIKIKNGVNEDVIEKYGVYSEKTAIEMARAVKDIFKTDISIGITGSLGIVDPNNSDSKKGEVYYAINYLDIKAYHIKCDDQGSKFLNKVYIAKHICDTLLDIVNNQRDRIYDLFY